MNKKLKLKIHESLSAVIPITLIVLALGMTVVPMELSTLMLFLAGAALLILGMGFQMHTDVFNLPTPVTPAWADGSEQWPPVSHLLLQGNFLLLYLRLICKFFFLF